MTRTMKRSSLAVTTIFILAACLSAERGKAPFINNRNLMRGARCQVLYPDQSSHEDVFGEVRSIVVAKTEDTGAWVIQFSDFDGCKLSFWTENGKMDADSIVRSISSY